MEKLILIKYGELTTKKQNRKVFINLLERNIKNVLIGFDYKLIKNRDRMFIESDNCDDIVIKLEKVFGIHRIVLCNKVNTNIDSIKELCLDIMKNNTFKTFKVETKRAYKEFPIHSMELNNIIGGLILKNIDHG